LQVQGRATGAPAGDDEIAAELEVQCRQRGVSCAGADCLDALVGLCGMLLLALATGVVESIMARLRLIRVSQLLAAATALSVLALMLVRRSP